MCEVMRVKMCVCVLLEEGLGGGGWCKSCSWKFRKIYWKTHVPESLF